MWYTRCAVLLTPRVDRSMSSNAMPEVSFGRSGAVVRDDCTRVLQVRLAAHILKLRHEKRLFPLLVTGRKTLTLPLTRARIFKSVGDRDTAWYVSSSY